MTIILLSSFAIAEVHVWSAISQTGVSCANQLGGSSDVARRTFIDNTEINESVNGLALYFKMNTVKPSIIYNASICEMDSTTWDCVDDTWTQVLFGNDLISPKVTSELYSDNLSFNIDSTKDYLVTYILENDTRCQYTPASGTNERYSNTITDSQLKDWSTLGDGTDKQLMSLTYIIRNNLTASNFTISSNVNSFKALINGSIYSTTSGEIETNILSNTSETFNIEVSPNNFLLNETYLNHNLSTPLNVLFPVINISAYNILNSSYVSNFSVLIKHDAQGYSETFNTITKNITLPLINGLFNLTIDSYDFALKSKLLTLSTDLNYTFLLPYTNSINITIYDQETGNLLTQNTTVRFTNSVGQFERTTTTANLFEYNLTAETWTIDFIAENYTVTSYTATITNRSFQSLNAYLLPSSDISTIFTIKDKDSGELVEDATIAVYKIINSDWTLINVLSSDVSGRAEITYEEQEKYKFTISKTSYDSKTFELNPILFASYNIFLNKDETGENIIDYSGVDINLLPDLIYNDETNNFSVEFLSPTGNLISYGFTATYKTESVTATGSNLYGEKLTGQLNVSGAITTDQIVIQYYYYDSEGLLHSFTETKDIIDGNSLFGTALSNKDNTYGIPLLDRVLIMVMCTVVAAGLVFLFGGLAMSGLMAMGIMGYFAYIKFINPWVSIISILILFALVAWRSSR